MIEKSSQSKRETRAPQVTGTDDALLGAWAQTLATRGDEPAIFDTRRRVLLRFREVEELSREFETGDQLQNFRAGEIIAIQIGNHAHWPALFLACLRRRLVVLPVEQSISEQERAAALSSCRAAGLITNAGEISRLTTNEPVDWKDCPPVLLKLTSGTTAAPRAIRFRGAQLLADARQICLTMGITCADLNFAVIPLSHSYGFSNLVTPLLGCGVAMVLSNDRLPRAVLDDLARTEATVFPGMPLFFQAFDEMTKTPPLPKLRLCISAGAPLTRNVADAFREKFGKPIHSFYGASECGGICYDRAAEPKNFDGFVGPAMEGVEVEPLVPNEKSTQLLVRSSAVGDGYFPEAEPEKLGGGFFRPDDLVEIGDGGVRIVGRVSDLINVAGKKVNPAEVEAQLLRHEQVKAAIVFGRASSRRNEEVVACVVATNANEAALLEFCRARLSGWQVPKRIFFLDELPANERGKINRRELARRFAS
jgi:acyl-CoA synthetase (AMP-forming)/AMP-acid ligase II